MLLFATAILAIGLLIGGALKPWKAKLFPKENNTVYYLLWAFVWPAILCHIVFKAMAAGVSALRRYFAAQPR